MANKVIHKNSSVITDGVPKLPGTEQLDYGEIAINYGDGGETISIKNSNNEIVEFKTKEYFENIIDDNEFVVASALSDLDDRVSNLSETVDGLMNNIDIPEASQTTLGGVKVGDSLFMNSEQKLNVKLSSGLALDNTNGVHVDLKTKGGLDFNSSGEISARVGTGLEIHSESGAICVNLGTGLDVNDATELGVKLGSGLIIGTEGTVNNAICVNLGIGLGYNDSNGIGFNLGKGLVRNSYNEICAKVGTGLEIDSTNGSVCVNLGTGLGVNNNSKLGVKIGTGLDVKDNSIGVKLGSGLIIGSGGTVNNAICLNVGTGLAYNDSNGIGVKLSTGLEVNNNGIGVKLGTGLLRGVYNQIMLNSAFFQDGFTIKFVSGEEQLFLDTASRDKIGGVKVGTGLSIDTDGVMHIYATNGLSGNTSGIGIDYQNIKLGTGLRYEENNGIHIGLGNYLWYSTENKNIYVLTGTTSDTVAVGNHSHSDYLETSHRSTTASSGATGHTKLVTGDLKSKTYTSGEAAAAAHTHSQYLTGYTEQYTGTVTKVKVNGVEKSPTNGLVDLGNIAVQDISGKADVNHTHKLKLSGDCSGSVTMTGSTEATLSVTVADDSHSHSNYLGTSHANATGSSGATGHVKLITGNLQGRTYTNGEAAAAAHTHNQYLTKDSVLCGMLNITDSNAVKTAQESLTSTNQVALYIITDNSGKLPSTQTCFDLSADMIKQLSLTSPNSIVNATLKLAHGSIDVSPIGVNVGDMIALTRVNVSASDLLSILGMNLGLTGVIELYQYRIISCNDAKAPNSNGITNGVIGLMTPSDKKLLSKISGIETTANYVRDKYLPFITQGGYDQNMNECFESGIYPWCLTGRPAGSADGTHFTLIVEKSTTADSGGYYTCRQTCYGREGADLGKIYQRIFFFKDKNTIDWYEGWKRIDNESTGSSNVNDKYYDEVDYGDLTTVNLEPNKYYTSYKQKSSLTITLGSQISGKMSEYLIEFRVNSTVTESMPITLPSSVKWVNGIIPSFLPGKTYQVSILNNKATYLEF